MEAKKKKKWKLVPCGVKWFLDASPSIGAAACSSSDLYATLPSHMISPGARSRKQLEKGEGGKGWWRWPRENHELCKRSRELRTSP
jgi:hypothetical protein